MTNFKVGEWVKVVKKVEAEGIRWYPNMDNCLGKIFEVVEIPSDNRILLHYSFELGRYAFHPESLEPATMTDRIIAALEDYREAQPGVGSTKRRRDSLIECTIGDLLKHGLSLVYKYLYLEIEPANLEEGQMIHDCISIFHHTLIHGKVDKELLVSGKKDFLAERMI